MASDTPEFLWPLLPSNADILGMVSIDVFTSSTGKPILRLMIGTRVIGYLTTNIAEMIGAAGRGARIRWEDHYDQMRGAGFNDSHHR